MGDEEQTGFTHFALALVAAALMNRPAVVPIHWRWRRGLREAWDDGRVLRL